MSDQSEPENIVVQCCNMYCTTQYITCTESFEKQENKCINCGDYKARRIKELELPW
jgi:hypothetical protein